MAERRLALLNTVALTLPLATGLVLVAIYGLDFPDSVIVPTIGGGLMNLGFFLFYSRSIKPIPWLRKSFFGRSRAMFLLVAFLHLVAISLLLTLDLRWALELF